MSNEMAVGISDPTTSRDALAWAMAHAVSVGAAIVLIHVLDHPPDPGEADAGRRMLARSCRRPRRCRRDRRWVRTLEGSVMWQLVAASDDYDLIVVGTHKTGFIHGSVYGSASLSLAATAACPVVVVPASTIVDRDGVVVGADDSVAGAAALAFAAAQAATAGESLTVVRVAADRRPRRRRRLLSRLVARSPRSTRPGQDTAARGLAGRDARGSVGAGSAARARGLQDRVERACRARVVCHDVLMNIRVPTAIVHGADRGATGPDPARRLVAVPASPPPPAPPPPARGGW